MPLKGISRKTDRSCLICSGQTRVAHLGIDVCRACSVFYRRAEKGNTYTCRTSTKKCPLGPELTCKRCRFDQIERLLKQSGAICAASPTDSSEEPSASPQTHTQASSPTTSHVRSELPILERLKTHYRSMCRERLSSELHARPDPPHPLQINIVTGPFFKTSFGALALSNRILLTALVEFVPNVFPELNSLLTQQKWDLIVNCFYRFRLFEGLYRANAVFPNDMNKAFAGYTTWFDAKDMEHFYDDAPTGDKAGAQEFMKTSALKLTELHAARELVQRVNPSHEEFLVVIALMFWTFGDMTVSEEVTQLGDRYREAIMKELHAFYRERLQLDDYATRLGELLMFLPVFDRVQDTREHFEMLRLLDILPADHFTYQLQRAD